MFYAMIFAWHLSRRLTIILLPTMQPTKNAVKIDYWSVNSDNEERHHEFISQELRQQVANLFVYVAEEVDVWRRSTRTTILH